MNTARGTLLVISGPSGTGKTSICHALLEQVPETVWSVSVTTRPRRGHEQDGEAYHFVDEGRFDELLAEDAFLEHATYLGHRYGTLKAPVEQAVARGQVVVMEIDVQGAAQVAARMPDSLRIFILPPTPETLQARLAGRRTETAELQARRLARADGEIAFARAEGIYQYFITNDILKDSIDEVIGILKQERERT